MKKLLVLFMLVVCSLMWAQNPPRNLAVEVDGSNAALTWKAPLIPNTMYWDTGSYGTSYGANSGTFDWTLATMYATTDLTGFVGRQITAVQYYVTDRAATHTVMIWTGTSANPPSTATVTQVASNLTDDQWNTITLTSPVTITGTQKVWIGVRVQSASGQHFPATLDDADEDDTITTKGNIVKVGTTWYNNFLTAAGVPGNWMIRGIVSGGTRGEDTPLAINNDHQRLTGDFASHTFTSHNQRNRDLSSYKVYIDDNLVETISNTDRRITFVTNLTPGNHIAYITAMDSSTGESAPSNIENITVSNDVLASPTNLTGNVVNVNNVYLHWDANTGNPGTETLMWDDGTYYTGLGGSANITRSCAQRFTTSDLTPYNGQYLKSVSFLVAAPGYYKVKVWTGGNFDEDNNEGTPGTLVAQKWVFAPSIEDWTVITLDTPILINSSRELWFGYSCYGTFADAVVYPNGMDNGPAIDYCGDLSSTKSAQSFYSIHQETIDNTNPVDLNWLIHGYLSTSAQGRGVTMLAHNAEQISSSNAGFHRNLDEATLQTRALGTIHAKNTPQRVQTGYKVYRDGTMVSEINDLNQNYYFDTFVPAGEHVYTVTGVYTAGESNASNAVTLTCGEVSIQPPANFSAAVQNLTSAHLSWEAPSFNNSTDALSWDDGTNADGIGTTNQTTFNVASRFETGDLTQYNGYTLTDVSFFPRAAGDYRIRVWVGGHISTADTTAYSGTLVVDQPVTTYNTEEWNKVLLYTPVEIDASQELWIGYQAANYEAEAYPAGCDAGPAVSWKGELMSFSAAGNIFYPMSVANTFNANWNIHGWVAAPRSGQRYANTPIIIANDANPGVQAIAHDPVRKQFARPVDRSLVGYNVYRNNTLLTTIDNPNTLTYDDVDLPVDTYSYYMKAVYTGEVLSDATQTITLTLSVPTPTALNAVIPPAHTSAILRWTEPADISLLTNYNIYRNGTLLGTAVTNRYTDSTIGSLNGSATYYVTALYNGTIESEPSNTLIISDWTGTNDDQNCTVTAAKGNYPNPFNPSTDIRFSLARAQKVNVSVYDVRGRKVVELANKHMNQGNQSITWNGHGSNGEVLAGGVYFCRIITEDKTMVNKMVMIK